jgi:hypothetical protein
MESKTPQFDKVLDEILKELVPHARKCKWQGVHSYCEGEFKIEEGDIEFLKLLRVPAPNFCPTCRRIRRLSHFTRAQLFKRKCDAPNHDEIMISIFPSECPFQVYDYEYFIGDEFDPFYFGKDYKINTSALNLLFELRKEFPIPSFLNRDPSSINSEYSNGGRNLKNGYYVMACYEAENTWYSNLIHKSSNIMDSHNVTNSEFVYEGFYSDHLYKSFFIYYSSNCTDSIFLFDCRNCSNCFGCVNLRNKKYCVFNKQYSKDEYEEFLNSFSPISRDHISYYKEKFWNLVKELPINASRNIVVENVLGVNLRNSKNLYDVIDAHNSENVRHAENTLTHRDSMDVALSGGGSSLLYMSTNIGSHSTRIKFSISSKFCTDCEFIFNCKNLNNCFMCFGLQNKSYCILNKQYSKDEYFKIVDEIKYYMLNNMEYSDGPGLEFSAVPYNFSTAFISFPLDNEEIKSIGGYLAKEPEINVGNLEILSTDKIPQTIEQTTNDILNNAIICEKTNRPFRIIDSELEFYRRMNLPLPSIHPVFRMEQRARLTPSGKKYEAICNKCSKNIETVFNPEDKFNLYCDDCYKKEIL